MFLSEWREFPLASCLAGKKKLDSLRLDVVEIARALTRFRAFFLPDRAKDLSASRVSNGTEVTRNTFPC